MEINLPDIAGAGLKYASLVGGINVFLTGDFPQDYALAGLCGFIYLAGEVMQRNFGDKQLKNLENKLKKTP